LMINSLNGRQPTRVRNRKTAYLQALLQWSQPGSNR